MDNNILFTITCTTCQTKLAVRDAAIVGDIVACPKCESMVQVVAPKGWVPPPSAARPTTPPAPPNPPPEPSAPAAPPAKKASAERPSGSKRVLPVDDDLDDTVTDLPAPQLKQPPPLPKRPAVPPAPPGSPPRPTESTDEIAVDLPPVQMPAPSRPWWQRKSLLLGLTALFLVLAAIWYARHKRGPLPEAPAVATPTPTVEQPPAAPVEKPAPPPPAPLDPRWLPRDTKLVVQMQLARVAGVAGSERLIAQVDRIWQAALGPMMTRLGLTQAAVARVTWASVDMKAWPEPGVLIVELTKNQDARALARAGNATTLVLAGATCRRLNDAAWPHPFAVLSEQVLVTGREALLAELAAAAEPTLPAESPLARLAKAVEPDPVFGVRVDLAAARAAGWHLPEALLDVWPNMAPAWRSLWQQADGVALGVCPVEKLKMEWAWTAGPGAKAEAVRGRMDELRTAAVAGLSVRIESLSNPAAPVASEATFLKQLAAALRGAKCEATAGVAKLEAQWEQRPAEALQPGLESRAALWADWLAAAWRADEAQHRRLGKALAGYLKAETHYPSAVAGAALVPPETRLSWIAALLPYLDQAEWHKQLAFEYSWDSPQNQPITKRTLGAVVNPLRGPEQAGAGYPVTHYVGVAGVGRDGPNLPAGHARAGVFGYGRASLPKDVPDGAANTIAILGVTERLGPWAAGGAATVRPLTKPPYFQGPDGFGSGQPQGMFAGMADGSVRFLSKDMDPKVIEQLATASGAEKVDVAALWPQPAAATPPAGPAAPAAGAPPAATPPAAPPKPEEMVPDAPAAEDEPEVDVESRLAGEIPAIVIENTSLLGFVRLISDLSGLPITLDLDTLARKGVKLSDPVQAKLKAATVRDVIEAVVGPRNLALVVSNNHVLITSPPTEPLRTTLYDVSDLARAGVLSPTGLAHWMQDLVAPASWKPAGGQGQFVLLGEGLSITQTEPVHAQILRFLERLRTARRLPPKSRLDPEALALRPTFQRAQKTLAQPVTFNFYPARPLMKTILPLEESCQVTLPVDWSALAAANVSAQVKGAVAVDKQPLHATLVKLLAPLKLTYRVVDTSVIEITTPKALAERLELEFYPVSAVMSAATTGDMFIEQLRNQVHKDRWTGSGGHGVVRFDEVSKHLLVLQSQPVHTDIVRYLSALPKATPPAAEAKPKK